jgi:hypothetical protein
MTFIKHRFFSRQTCAAFSELSEVASVGVAFPECAYKNFVSDAEFQNNNQVNLYYLGFSSALKKLQSLLGIYMHIMNNKPHCYRLDYVLNDDTECASQFNRMTEDDVSNHAQIHTLATEQEFAFVQLELFIKERFQKTKMMNDNEAKYYVMGEELALKYWEHVYKHIENDGSVEEIIDQMIMPLIPEDHRDKFDTVQGWLSRNIIGYEPRII